MLLQKGRNHNCDHSLLNVQQDLNHLHPLYFKIKLLIFLIIHNGGTLVLVCSISLVITNNVWEHEHEPNFLRPNNCLLSINQFLREKTITMHII